MQTKVQRRAEPSAETPNHDADTWARVQRSVTRALSAHPHFNGRTNTIRIEYDHDTAIVTGRLPSFYLKQLLQEALRQVDGVERIDNRVDVICCNGVSSALKSATAQDSP